MLGFSLGKAEVIPNGPDDSQIHGHRLRTENLGHYQLFESVGDSSTRQIIWRHFDADAIAYENTYAVFSHLAGNRREDNVRAVIQLHFEKGVGLFVDNCALRGN